MPHQQRTPMPPAARPAAELALALAAKIVAFIAKTVCAAAFALATCIFVTAVTPPLAFLLVALACVSERSAPSGAPHEDFE